MSRVEDAGLNASAPPRQWWLDGWLLRALPGKARRARCINALAPGRLALEERLQLAAEVFRAAGLPMLFRMHRFSQPAGLEGQLESLGWTVADRTTVMILPRLKDRTSTPAQTPGLVIETMSSQAFAETVGALRGSPVEHREAHALRLQHSPVPYQGFVLRRPEDGTVLACGQFAREGHLVGLYDVFTHEAARNQRLASFICEHMLSVSALQGADVAYLQVESANAPARSVYRRLGFMDAYEYHYREAPEAAPSA